MFVVLPAYLSAFPHSLQCTVALFFLSGSVNLPSIAGNPKYSQTALVAPSSGKNVLAPLDSSPLAMLHMRMRSNSNRIRDTALSPSRYYVPIAIIPTIDTIAQH